MIILKNTKNTQTFYVSKKCGIESGQLPVGSYTKIEADERFQPKGNYISEEKAEELINTEITNLKGEVEELETSKMEVFQANQPLSLHRNGEGLQLSVDLSNYATKADKSELSNYVTTDAYNTKMTELDGEISAIQAQIGNISTTLDTINGEIPNE